MEGNQLHIHTETSQIFVSFVGIEIHCHRSDTALTKVYVIFLRTRNQLSPRTGTALSYRKYVITTHNKHALAKQWKMLLELVLTRIKHSSFEAQQCLEAEYIESVLAHTCI